MAKKKTPAQRGAALFVRGAKLWLTQVGMHRVRGVFYPYRLMTTLGTLKIDVLDDAADGSAGFTMRFLDEEAARRALRKDRFFNEDSGVWILTWSFKSENLGPLSQAMNELKQRIVPILPSNKVLLLSDFHGTIHGAVLAPPEFNQALVDVAATAARQCYNQQIVMVDIETRPGDTQDVMRWIDSKNGR